MYEIFTRLVEAFETNDVETVRKIVSEYGGVNYDKIRNKSSIYRIFELAKICLKKYDLNNVRIYVFDYDKKCNKWHRLQIYSRGTYAVTDRSGNIEVFIPFEKFFNLDERVGWMRSDLEKMRLVETTRKADGTLIIAFHSNILERWILATRRVPHFYDAKHFRTYPLDVIANLQILHAVQIEPKLKHLDKHLAGLENYVHMFEAVDPYDYNDMFYNLGSSRTCRHEKKPYVAYLTCRRICDLYLLRYSEAHELIHDFYKIEKIYADNLEEVEKLVMRGELGEGAVLRYESDILYRLVKLKNFIENRTDLPNIVQAVVLGYIDDLLPHLDGEKRRFAETCREFVYVLQLYVNAVRSIVESCNYDVNCVREKLRVQEYAVLTHIDLIVDYLRGRTRFLSLVMKFVRTLKYDVESMNRFIERVNRYVQSVS